MEKHCLEKQIKNHRIGQPSKAILLIDLSMSSTEDNIADVKNELILYSADGYLEAR